MIDVRDTLDIATLLQTILALSESLVSKAENCVDLPRGNGPIGG